MGPREGPFLLHVRRPCWKHDSLYHINREKKSTFLAPLALLGVSVSRQPVGHSDWHRCSNYALRRFAMRNPVIIVGFL